MARFEPRLDKVEALSEDFQKLSNLTYEDAWKILEPAGEFLRVKFKEKIQALFTRYSKGRLRELIISMRKAGGDGPYIQVYPYGTHHTYQGREKTKMYKRTKHGRTYTYGGGTRKSTADEVAFILEYGSGTHKAYHWMENTINENVEELHEKYQEGFDAWCDERGVGS